MNCQICSCPDLLLVFDAGYLPAVNVMRKVGEPPRGEKFYPAQLFLCPRCSLVQLGYLPDQREVFPNSYPYRSGNTEALLDNFADLAHECVSLGYIKSNCNELVVDCGSNDGSLLRCFKGQGCRVYGIEPTAAAFDAEIAGIPTRQDFLNEWTAKVAVTNNGKAEVVTACNVFAHMPDVHDALDCVLEILADDGVFVIEAHYLMTLLSKSQFDTVYSEHARYYSLTSLKYLLEMHGMEILRCRQTPTHGGSIRVYAARKGKHEVKVTFDNGPWGDDGGEQGINWLREFDAFRNNCIEGKLALYDLLMQEHAYGEDAKVYGIGAPSRATTLIHYCGLDNGILDRVCEQVGSKKIGHCVPGTSIPIVDEEKLYQDKPPYALVLSWHLADEIVGKLRQKGYRGKIVIPLPYPKVVE